VYRDLEHIYRDLASSVDADEQVLARELERIEEALRRLESGRYGYCKVCGQSITLARLELDPTVETCSVCAGDVAEDSMPT
jgi:RNA polymerase-binding transcription factor DksA